MLKKFWFTCKPMGYKGVLRDTVCVKSKHLNGAVRKFYQTYDGMEITKIL